MQSAAEQMPVEVEDRLAGALTDVDDDAVVVESFVASRFRDEREHALRFVRRELLNVAERLDVALRDDEQMRVGLWVDVADRHETRAGAHVLALAVEPAEETVVRQRGSPPP